MANPRKFSEKIALHNQKQAEETAAFDEIMRQVQSTTRVTLIIIEIWMQCTRKHHPNSNDICCFNSSRKSVNYL